MGFEKTEQPAKLVFVHRDVELVGNDPNKGDDEPPNGFGGKRIFGVIHGSMGESDQSDLTANQVVEQAP